MQKGSKEEIKKGAAFAAVSYIFFACIFVLMYKKENKFAQFHAKQALVLFIALVICWFLGAIIPGFLILGSLLSVFGTMVYLICAAVGIFASLMGIEFKFPLVSDIAKKMVI